MVWYFEMGGVRGWYVTLKKVVCGIVCYFEEGGGLGDGLLYKGGSCATL